MEESGRGLSIIWRLLQKPSVRIMVSLPGLEPSPPEYKLQALPLDTAFSILTSILTLRYHLHLGVPNGIFSSSSRPKFNIHVYISPIRATCPASLISLNLICSVGRIRPSGLFHFRINVELWILQTVGRTTWMGNQPVARPVPTRDNTSTENTLTFETRVSQRWL
jgi:hypothetical protein